MIIFHKDECVPVMRVSSLSSSINSWQILKVIGTELIVHLRMESNFLRRNTKQIKTTSFICLMIMRKLRIMWDSKLKHKIIIYCLYYLNPKRFWFGFLHRVFWAQKSLASSRNILTQHGPTERGTLIANRQDASSKVLQFPRRCSCHNLRSVQNYKHVDADEDVTQNYRRDTTWTLAMMNYMYHYLNTWQFEQKTIVLCDYDTGYIHLFRLCGSGVCFTIFLAKHTVNTHQASTLSRLQGCIHVDVHTCKLHANMELSWTMDANGGKPKKERYRT